MPTRESIQQALATKASSDTDKLKAAYAFLVALPKAPDVVTEAQLQPTFSVLQKLKERLSEKASAMLAAKLNEIAQSTEYDESTRALVERFKRASMGIIDSNDPIEAVAAKHLASMDAEAQAWLSKNAGMFPAEPAPEPELLDLD